MSSAPHGLGHAAAPVGKCQGHGGRLTRTWPGQGKPSLLGMQPNTGHEFNTEIIRSYLLEVVGFVGFWVYFCCGFFFCLLHYYTLAPAGCGNCKYL